MVPAFRPRSPLRVGPTLFFAVGPTSWQARHFLNTSSPFSTLASVASALGAPAAASSNSMVVANTFIRGVLRRWSCCEYLAPESCCWKGWCTWRDQVQQLGYRGALT